MFQAPVAKSVPSSNESPGQRVRALGRTSMRGSEVQVLTCYEGDVGDPASQGRVANGLCKERAIGTGEPRRHSLPTTPSHSQLAHPAHKDDVRSPPTPSPKKPVTEAVAAVKFSTGTPRRHFSLSPASAHPTSATKLSKHGCWLEKFPVGSKVPQDRTAARKRPSLSPPFVTICAPTENPPALGPQLYAHCGVRETGLT